MFFPEDFKAGVCSATLRRYSPAEAPTPRNPGLAQIFVFFPEDVKVGVKTIKVGTREIGV